MNSDQPPASSGRKPHGHGDANAKRGEPPTLGKGPPSSGWMPEDFITEADAYAAYGHVLEDKELRNARCLGRIGFMRRKRTIFYRRDELVTFVSSLLRQDYVEPCPQRTKHGRMDYSPAQFQVGLKPQESSLEPSVRQRALKLLS